MPLSLNSLILIDSNKYHTKSSAVLRICKDLKGAYKLFFVLLVLPKSTRDFGYDIIANNRHRIFNNTNACIIPAEDVRIKFLD